MHVSEKLKPPLSLSKSFAGKGLCLHITFKESLPHFICPYIGFLQLLVSTRDDANLIAVFLSH